MNAKEKYTHWLNLAVYDIDTAEAMLNSGRYLYVAFTCQQAIEKLTKGIYVYNYNKEAKYTHNINFILEDIDSVASSSEYKSFFNDLTSYYIIGRYDAYKQELAQELDFDKAKFILMKTREAFAWLKSQVKL